MNKIHVATSKGWYQFTVGSPEAVIGLFFMQDGKGAVMTGSQTTRITFLDIPGKKLPDFYTLPALNTWLKAAGEDCVYLNAALGFVSYNVKTGEMTELVNWANSKIDSSKIDIIFPCGDDFIALEEKTVMDLSAFVAENPSSYASLLFIPDEKTYGEIYNIMQGKVIEYIKNIGF